MKAANLWVEAAAFRVKTAALRVNAAALGVKTATMMVKAAAFSVKTVSRVRATEQSLHSENKDRAICLFSFAFGGSIPMKLQSNLVSLPGIITYFRTSREALAKRISMAQARFQRQNGHANEAEKQSLYSENQERALVFFFLAFGGSTMLKFMQSLGDIP